MRIVTRLLQGIALLFAVLLCLVPIGTAFPHAYGFGPFAGMFTLALGPWICIVAAVGVSAASWRWKARRSRLTAWIAAAFAIALIGTAAELSVIASAVGRQGIALDFAQAVAMRSEADAPRHRVVQYATIRGEAMPLVVVPPRSGSARPAPIFLYIHGGGFTTGRFDGRLPDFKWFASQGMVAISVEYPLSSRSRHLWNHTANDVGCAVAWVAAHARSFGGDPMRIVLAGESAGGNLALNVALLSSAGRLRSSCGGQAPIPAAVVALYPAIDLAWIYDHPDRTVGGIGMDAGISYTGGTPSQVPERYAATSSFTYLHPGAPPTLIVVPGSDVLVPPDRTREFAAAAGRLNNAVTLIEVPLAGHSFDMFPGSLGNQIIRQATLDFLRARRLLAEPSPK